MTTMIERVARALWFTQEAGSWDSWEDAVRDLEAYEGGAPEKGSSAAQVLTCRQAARAAIEAMREPTEDMLPAPGSIKLANVPWPVIATSVWQAMITAALKDRT